MGTMQAMAVNDDYGGRDVANEYVESAPSPNIFLLIDGAPIVYKGNHTNATAIAEFATETVAFRGQVVESTSQLDFSRNTHRPKLVFYTQKGEVC